MPWSIDLKQADLCLATSESPELRPTEIVLNAAMLADGPTAGEASEAPEVDDEDRSSQPAPGETLLLAARPPQLGPGPIVEIRPIRITFRDAYAARMIPGEGDMPFDVWAYDMPGEPLRDFGESIELWRESEERWAESGVCECPGFYKVFPSSWMAELAQDQEGYHHYLVTGRCASAEVIAKGWRWERIEE
jgi:hypothetical protein